MALSGGAGRERGEGRRTKFRNGCASSPGCALMTGRLWRKLGHLHQHVAKKNAAEGGGGRRAVAQRSAIGQAVAAPWAASQPTAQQCGRRQSGASRCLRAWRRCGLVRAAQAGCWAGRPESAASAAETALRCQRRPGARSRGRADRGRERYSGSRRTASRKSAMAAAELPRVLSSVPRSAST